MLYLKPAKPEDIPALTDISKRAFDTDILVGNTEPGGPPGYDEQDFHTQMLREGHLFTFFREQEITGGAILFVNGNRMEVGRIFIDPALHRRGMGLRLMKAVELMYPQVTEFRLDTPVWNRRTNAFYPRAGYIETGRDAESVCYVKKK
ncbi:MAG: GNAT family N-acetyltransferase [Clostridiales bacterium]|nr:GNAT family N-acetyltransferase [Clostridiales bacterium]